MKSFKRLGLERRTNPAANNVKVNRVLTCAPNDWYHGASVFISACMALLQQMDKYMDKVERCTNGLVWKAMESFGKILNCYDMAVRFYISNSTIKKTTDKIKEDVEKARANNVRYPNIRSEGRITRLDAAAKVKNSYFFGEVTPEYKLVRETMSGGKKLYFRSCQTNPGSLVIHAMCGVLSTGRLHGTSAKASCLHGKVSTNRFERPS